MNEWSAWPRAPTLPSAAPQANSGDRGASLEARVGPRRLDVDGRNPFGAARLRPPAPESIRLSWAWLLRLPNMLGWPSRLTAAPKPVRRSRAQEDAEGSLWIATGRAPEVPRSEATGRAPAQTHTGFPGLEALASQAFPATKPPLLGTDYHGGIPGLQFN